MIQPARDVGYEGSDLRNHVGRQLPGEDPVPQRVSLALLPAVAAAVARPMESPCVRSGGTENPS
jgi:hypothetical protein